MEKRLEGKWEGESGDAESDLRRSAVVVAEVALMENHVRQGKGGGDSWEAGKVESSRCAS